MQKEKITESRINANVSMLEKCVNNSIRTEYLKFNDEHEVPINTYDFKAIPLNIFSIGQKDNEIFSVDLERLNQNRITIILKNTWPRIDFSVVCNNLKLLNEEKISKIEGEIEATIHVLRILDYKYEKVIKQLEEKMPICTDAIKLENFVRNYPWYIEVSRRNVTLAHVSEKGLSKRIVNFIGYLTKTNPAMAFVLSPTTLHDNTLVSPQYAPYFTCNPFLSSNLSDVKTTYTSVVEQYVHKLERFDKVNSERVTFEVAKSRLENFIKPILGEEGKFPWRLKQDVGCIIAGGLPCAVVLDENRWQSISKITDIDIFVYGDSDVDRKDMVFLLLDHFSKIGAKFERFKSVIKVFIENCVEIQIICPYARSPLGVLINFDSTFIQIGYDGESFISTPGHCFFTPRNESLITRYNFRFHRFIKILERGFIPVSDERGHIMYPRKMFFSARWKLFIEEPINPDVGDIRNKLERREYSNAKREIRKQKDIEFGKKLVLNNEEGKQLREKVEARVSTILRVTKELGIQIWTIGVIDENCEEHTCRITTSKPYVEWEEKTIEEIRRDFKPEENTLSNGFDIYTQGVNSVLPNITEAGILGIDNRVVLLRNVQILEEKPEYNLASSKDKPLNVKHLDFVDSRKVFPVSIYEADIRKERVRMVEGIFLFNMNDKEKSSIQFSDLHRSVEEVKDIKTINIEELPRVLDAFSKGNVYESSEGLIKKSDLMVKVITPLFFNPCIAFDVDDLFYPQNHLDQNVKFNAVVHLNHIYDWIIEPHEHKKDITVHKKDVVFELMKQELEILEKKNKKTNTAAGLLRAIRNIANDLDFEMKLRERACHLRHPDPGLIGAMPSLTCTRVYISKHHPNPN